MNQNLHPELPTNGGPGPGPVIEDRLLTVKDLAQFLQLSTRQIRKLKNEGVIPYVQINGAVRFEPRAVVEALGLTASLPLPLAAPLALK